MLMLVLIIVFLSVSLFVVVMAPKEQSYREEQNQGLPAMAGEKDDSDFNNLNKKYQIIKNE